MERRGQREKRDLPEPSLPEESSPRPPRGAHGVSGQRKEGGAGAQYSGAGAARKGADGPGTHGPTAWGGDLLPVVGTPWKLLTGKPREMMWLLFAGSPWGQEEVRETCERPLPWSG